jgi:hypothetical protein
MDLNHVALGHIVIFYSLGNLKSEPLGVVIVLNQYDLARGVFDLSCYRVDFEVLVVIVHTVFMRHFLTSFLASKKPLSGITE